MKIIERWLTSNKKAITYIVFEILLVVRVMSGYISTINQNNIAQSFSSFYITVSLITLTIFILTNKDDLGRFNIDRYVIYTFILSGIMSALSFSFSLSWITAIICSLIIWKAQLNSKLEPSQTGNFLHILLFVCMGILPGAIQKLFLSDYYQGYKFFAGLSMGTIFAIIGVTLWGVIFEEMLFRSITWGVLRDWQLSDNKIVLTQAVLFWLAHLDLIASKSFGLPVLVFGIWVGFLTQRSKSLAPGMATHFFHNITSRLF